MALQEGEAARETPGTGVPRRLVVADVETTGLDPGKSAIWEVSAYLVTETGIVSAFHSRCRPIGMLKEHREVLRRVCGLQDKEIDGLEHAPSPSAVNAALLVWYHAVCGGPLEALWTSFNVEFDRKFLAFLPWEVSPTWWCGCVMREAQRRMGFRPRLADACEKFGVPLSKAHSSAADARAAALLVQVFGLEQLLSGRTV